MPFIYMGLFEMVIILTTCMSSLRMLQNSQNNEQNIVLASQLIYYMNILLCSLYFTDVN